MSLAAFHCLTSWYTVAILRTVESTGLCSDSSNFIVEQNGNMNKKRRNKN